MENKNRRPKKFDYNLIVIGAGSAGLVTSLIASALKAKVALIEKDKMGGDCLNSGCVPSKALIKSARVLRYFKNAELFGFDSFPVDIKFEKVLNRVQRVIGQIKPKDSLERYQGMGVDCIKGKAQILSPFEVEVNGKILTTKNIVIATGAAPFIPKIPGLENIKFLTSDNIWNIRELPKRLLILGGGPLGCEIAQAFATFGSKITIIEKSKKILNREDNDVFLLLSEEFKKNGIEILNEHIAIRIESGNNIKKLICDNKGKEVSVNFDEILVALGRRPQAQGFGLEELGVEFTERKSLKVDSYLRTTKFKNIFACGDVASPFQFTHTAGHEALCVVINALFSPFKSVKVDYSVIPWCTFTSPEVARVGFSEEEAKKNGIPYEISFLGLDDLDRAIAESENLGFVKVLTVPGKDKILGVTIVGSQAGEMITEFICAMKHGIGLKKILETIHIYPTFSEANKLVAGVWRQQSTPNWFFKVLGIFHKWKRS